MRPIRLSIVGNPDSVHVSRWARHFADRGFDVTLLTFYQSGMQDGDHLHLRYLRPRSGGGGAAGRSGRSRVRIQLAEWLPGTMRLATAARYNLAGFRQQLRASRPDIVHGHYLSNYAFIAALGDIRPLVTTAWGSDVLRDPHDSVVTKKIVQWVIGQSALITYSANAVAEACSNFGARADQLFRVVLGVDSAFLDAVKDSPRPSTRPPVIVSYRSLDRAMFNIDVIIQAMPEVLRRVPGARLLIGNSGQLEPELRELASRLRLAASVEFIGHGDARELANRMGQAAVYVALPDTDASSVTLLEAMAAGAFPVVSDIPASREWVSPDDGIFVPTRDAHSLAAALTEALQSPERRDRAAERNRDLIEREGRWDRNMPRLEEAYRLLV